VSRRPPLLHLGWKPPFGPLIAAGRRHWWLVVRSAVSAGLVTLLLASIDAARFTQVLGGARLEPVAAAAASFLLGQVLFAYRWRLVLAARTSRPPSVCFLTGAILVGHFFNFLLPSNVGGDVVRAELVRAHARGRVEAYASVLFDRFIAVNAILVISFAAALLARLRFDWFDPRVAVAWLVFVLGSAGFAAGTLWMPTGGHPDRGRQRLFDGVWLRLGQVQCTLRDYITDVSLVGSVFIFAIAAVFCSLIMAVWLLARGLGIEVPLLFHLVAVPIIELIALVPISFNGIGLREGAYVFLYAQIGLAPEAALALSLAWTLLLLTFSLVGGLCWLWPGLYDAGRTHAKRGADR
jgi:uncharacterized membrane protein YbhN (UPF0104 family)